MDIKEEYHDPDYPAPIKEETTDPETCSDKKISDKIKSIVSTEFSKEILKRGDEVKIIEQRMAKARKLLYRLRYTIVSRYYNDQRLLMSNSQIQDEIAEQNDPRARAEVTAILKDQKRIHPSIKKLLGKSTVNIDEIIFDSKPRNVCRKNYSEMAKSKKSRVVDTAPPSNEMEIEISQPKKIPRQIDPKQNVLVLDETSRHNSKHRYRIVIGNTSKYAPGASAADRSTHKWLLYVRGPKCSPDVSKVIASVTVHLHHSYAPHHVVRVAKAPFHVSRRGWGEFDARLELNFPLPKINRPVTVTHTIRLDRNYTGLQTLGAETIADVWLYSTEDMLPYVYKEDDEPSEMLTNSQQTKVKSEKKEISNDWIDFFNTTKSDMNLSDIASNIKTETDIDNFAMDAESGTALELDSRDAFAELKMDEDWRVRVAMDIPEQIINNVTPKKRIMKYIDQNTHKIYYLEVDRSLDLSQVQEIIIDDKGAVKKAKIASPSKVNGYQAVKKKTVTPKKENLSLLKPEVKKEIKNRCSYGFNANNFPHLVNDHCYLSMDQPIIDNAVEQETESKEDSDQLVHLCNDVGKMNCVRTAVNYLLRNIPLITSRADDEGFVKSFPFVVRDENRFWKLDFAKRRNIEWSRSKLIQRILTNHSKCTQIWRTKQILVYSRLHGYYPIRTHSIQTENKMEKNNPENWITTESDIKILYPKASDISSYSLFNESKYLNESLDTVDLSNSDDDIDVLTDKEKKIATQRTVSECSLEVMPANEEDRLKYMYVEKVCSDIGVELRNEDIGHGFSYSAAHAVLLSAMRSFAEELIRRSLAVKLAGDAASQGKKMPPVWTGSSSSRIPIHLEHVFEAAKKFSVVSSSGLATLPKQAYPI